MIGRILRTGDDLVVTVPKEMLDALQLGEGEEVSVVLNAEGTRIVIAPGGMEADGVDAHFAKQVAEFIQEVRPALEALAK